MHSSNRSSENPTIEKFLKYVTAIVVCWYVVLCVANYLSKRPLWNDEECVFLSIKTFTAWQMFHEPLKAIQVFPRVYLFLIQQISKPFNFDLLALRFLPFVCMLSAFFIWLKIVSLELKNRVEYLTFVLSWSASAVLIYYSAELKQYSMDVLAASLFLLFFYHQEEIKNDNRGFPCALAAVLLPILGMFSYIAFLFSIILLYNLFIIVKRNKKMVNVLIYYVISLLTVGVLSYLFDMRFRHIETVTKGFGDYFVSFNSLSEFLKTFGEGTNNLFSRWFVERPKVFKKIGLFFVSFGFLYMFYGFLKNIKKNRYILKTPQTIAFVVFVELFILGALQRYPFTVPRTSLFFCPVILYLTVKGITSLKRFNIYLYRIVHICYVIFLIFLAVALSHITFLGKLTFRPVLW